MFERLETRRLLSADLQGGVLNVTGSDAADNIKLVISGDQIVVQEDSGDTSFALSDVTSIHVRAGGGDDHVQFNPDVPAAEIEGEGGDDTLIGGDGDDTLEGGGGNDYLDGKGGADIYDGGGGFDSADYRYRNENLFITLNDQADDGARGGAEGDNVLSSVERVMGGDGDDIIVGDDADNSIAAGGGNDTVSGVGGNDSLDGDAGDDWLIGDGGDDRLTGGPGRDLMEGRAGDDTFLAEDGEADNIEGGGGTDTLETADLQQDQWNDVENVPHAAAGEITVLRGKVELVDGKSAVDFGTGVRGEIGPSRTFTIRNDGDAALNIADIILPDGFMLVEDPSGNLAPGESHTFTIQLNTGVLGEQRGVVRIRSNDADEDPFNFDIMGIVQDAAQSPEITVTLGGRGLNSNSGTVKFGKAAAAATGPSKTFTVRNDGTGTLALGGVFVSRGFAVTEGLSSSLGAGQSDTFTIQMLTSKSGALKGHISLRSNDSNENPFMIKVNGSVARAARPAKAQITVTQGSSRIGNGATINLGNVVAGRGAKVITLKVLNNGNGNLALGKVRAPAGFTLTKAPPKTLAPHKSATLSLRLNDSGIGAKSGTITLGSGSARVTFTVRGSVVSAGAGGGGGGGGTVNATLDSFGTLIIRGTPGNDSIIVKGTGNSATVTENGASKTFNGVKKIGIDAGEGNDNINLSGISLPSSIDGKGGADTLIGGGGADVLHGGLGNDSIVGGFGADQLFGDDGDDKLDAVDGTPDTKVDGGNGNDTIKADPTDSKTGT